MTSLNGYRMTVYRDVLAPGSESTLSPGERALWIAEGGVRVDGRTLGAGAGWVGGACALAGGAMQTILWRWEVTDDGAEALTGVGGLESQAVLSASLPDLAAEEGWLLRCDSVRFPPGGCALTHVHPGPGIRVLVAGSVRIDAAGHSTSYAPEEAWFEAGPEPVFAQAGDVATRFVRAMLVPARFAGQRTIRYVNASDADKPKTQSAEVFAEAPAAL